MTARDLMVAMQSRDAQYPLHNTLLVITFSITGHQWNYISKVSCMCLPEGTVYPEHP